MGVLLLQVAIYGIGGAVAAPAGFILSCLILAESKRPILNVWLFTAGAALLSLLVFTVVLIGFGDSSTTIDLHLGAIIGIGLGSLFLLMGVLAVFETENPEKQSKRREQAKRIASSSAPKLILTGVIVQAINFDALAVYGAGVKAIAVADDVSATGRVVAFLIGLALMLILYWAPAVIYPVSPVRAGGLLRRMSSWMLSHSRPLEIVIGFVIGGVFLWHGIADLR